MDNPSNREIKCSYVLTILITVFLLIHARIDLNQYYKKMVRLISISGLQYYGEEQGIV